MVPQVLMQKKKERKKNENDLVTYFLHWYKRKLAANYFYITIYDFFPFLNIKENLL
jgi:hypothetical protein